jgi:hypothetical protein
VSGATAIFAWNCLPVYKTNMSVEGIGRSGPSFRACTYRKHTPDETFFIIRATGDTIDGMTLMGFDPPVPNANLDMTGSMTLTKFDTPFPNVNGDIAFSVLLVGSAFWMMHRKKTKG